MTLNFQNSGEKKKTPFLYNISLPREFPRGQENLTNTLRNLKMPQIIQLFKGIRLPDFQIYWEGWVVLWNIFQSTTVCPSRYNCDEPLTDTWHITTLSPVQTTLAGPRLCSGFSGLWKSLSSLRSVCSEILSNFKRGWNTAEEGFRCSGAQVLLGY